VPIDGVEMVDTSNGSSPLLSCTSVLPLNQWTHLVATSDGATKRLYVNGVLDASSGPLSGSIPAESNPFTIGNVGSGGGRAWQGRIDEVSVYATALNGSQVAAHYAAGSVALPTAPGPSPTSTAYSYDKLYRLTGVGPAGQNPTTTYTYDPLGNRLSKGSTSYTYDKSDRILTVGSTNYTVNNAGNQTNRGSDSFSYDQANRLTSATVNGTTGTYVYDGDGKRVSKTVSGVTTNYIYDVGGGLPVLLDDGVNKYVWGAGGLAYSFNKSSGAVNIYHTDGLGSVRALTDSTGSVVQTYQTDEFGMPTLSQGTSTQPFGFTREQRDLEDGLAYLRARMYDPTVGRFLQRDPLKNSGAGVSEWNRYSYADNTPTRITDPSGLAICVGVTVAQALPGDVITAFATQTCLNEPGSTVLRQAINGMTLYQCGRVLFGFICQDKTRIGPLLDPATGASPSCELLSAGTFTCPESPEFTGQAVSRPGLLPGFYEVTTTHLSIAAPFGGGNIGPSFSNIVEIPAGGVPVPGTLTFGPMVPANLIAPGKSAVLRT